MIDFTELPHNDDSWELFSRDFLEQLGFFIESPPNRGADGGKDILISEEVAGKLHRYKFRWLVSCKHFALSGKSVNENDDEKNILERVKGFNADGFIGFYSTLPSAGLVNRLDQLKTQADLRDYRIFDGKIIENQLLTKGFSNLTSRYFPTSHKQVRPIHNVIDEYIELKCDKCGKDLLESLYDDSQQGVYAVVSKHEHGKEFMLEAYFACKGLCDKALEQAAYAKYKEATAWKDISDLAMPNDYLRWILSTINQLASGNYVYEAAALRKEKQLIMALAQKVFREVSERERARLQELMQYGL